MTSTHWFCTISLRVQNEIETKRVSSSYEWHYPLAITRLARRLPYNSTCYTRWFCEQQHTVQLESSKPNWSNHS